MEQLFELRISETDNSVPPQRQQVVATILPGITPMDAIWQLIKTDPRDLAAVCATPKFGFPA